MTIEYPGAKQKNRTRFVALMFGGWIATTSLVLLVFSGKAEEIQLNSKWDANLLNVELGDVNIKPSPPDGFTPAIIIAWEQITAKYFLRANIYLDSRGAMDATRFSFKKEKATGKELFDAFLVTYPAYTYTQDPKTGVIWFHPKNINYDNILNNKMEIRRSALQVPMYLRIIKPLLQLLNQKAFFDPDQGSGESFADADMNEWNNSVDLPSGVYSARDILNFCCLSSPNLAFWLFVETDNGRVSSLTPFHLIYGNPLALERVEAIKFWDIEIGDITNVSPSPDLIAATLSDDNFRKRWAAREYVKATPYLSHGITSADSKIAVWEAFGFNVYAEGGLRDYPYLHQLQMFADNKPTVLDDLLREDPGLALITSMELARETKDSGIMDVVSGHKFTEAEIADVKPDVYRIARESKLVRDKLLAMKFDIPELSPAALNELANTNLFTLVPAEKK